MREMRSFRSGQRVGSVMNRVARAYSDEDLSRMSAILAPSPDIKPSP
jgi:cytochrome c553